MIKVGIDIKLKARVFIVLSMVIPDLKLLIIPKGTARIKANICEMTINSIVTGRRWKIAESTGSSVRKDCPNLPCTASKSQRVYLKKIFLLSPRSSRIASTSSSEAPKPAVVIAISPGKKFTMRKVSAVTARTTTMSRNNFLLKITIAGNHILLF
ncbi:MAG: hypothetical protein GY857_02895 [Desulfobacula sp.]|nr:hypothetical protein [Desulfobacula sp.]